MERDILHCDMNNFFASVECRLNPELKKYPVAVCGSVEERHGIVLAKNELAKAQGVKTAETVASAKSKCRGLVMLPPHFEEYLRYSRLARRYTSGYTDLIEPFGMDECWLDISGTRRLFGAPAKGSGRDKAYRKEELWAYHIGRGIVQQGVCKARKRYEKTGCGDGDTERNVP